MEFYIYAYLDPRKPGNFLYGDLKFDYEPFYIGKGKGNRWKQHLTDESEKNKNQFKKNKINKIISLGMEPIVIKVIENLTDEDSKLKEKELIFLIGRRKEGGPLVNIADGGDGGITWEGEHHNKGKTFEQIVGDVRAKELKEKLSEQAKQRTGDKNPNFGNRGEKNSNYGSNNLRFGIKLSEEEKQTISKNTKKALEAFTEEERLEWQKKAHDVRKSFSEEKKIEIGNKISKRLKGRVFSDDHKENISKTSYKSKMKGKDVLKLSQDTKTKLSDALKGREFNESHRLSLRKTMIYSEWKSKIENIIMEYKIRSITEYRSIVKNNPELSMTQVPEKGYKNDGWEGWDLYKDLMKSQKKH